MTAPASGLWVLAATSLSWYVSTYVNPLPVRPKESVLKSATWDSFRRRRRSLLVTMGLVIAAVATGFAFVVYPWGLLMVPSLDVWTLLKEVYPLAALLLLTVLFLADMVRSHQQQEREEQEALRPDSEADDQAMRRNNPARDVVESIDRILADSAALLAQLPQGRLETEEGRRLVEEIRRQAGRARKMTEACATATPDKDRDSSAEGPPARSFP